jgi:peptide/nickel transport system permease protein
VDGALGPEGRKPVTTAAVPTPRLRRRPAPLGLGRYVAGRLVAAAGVLLVVSVVVFSFVHASPGGPENSIAGPMATQDQLATIRAQYGLDRPLHEQYLQFLTNALGGDLGTSFTRRTTVVDALGDAAAVTVPLMVITWVFTMVLGVSMGIVTAFRAGGRVDRFVLGATTVGASAPAFAVGTLLIWIFGIRLGWFPVLGVGDGGMDRVRHLVLPALTASVTLLAGTTRITRVRVGQILDEDQMTFVRARGLGLRWQLQHTIMRNAAVMVVTLGSSMVISLVAGLIVVEQVFNLPGLGTLLVGAIQERDIAVVQGVTLVCAIVVVLMTLLADVLCMVVDPRLRVGRDAIR